MSTDATSKLFIVATPIGNLGDISSRAITTLQTVDYILCEDTRTFGKLAKAYSIDTPLKSYHEHNERTKLSEIERLFDEGAQIALVSDAGTPLVSDPGYHVVNSAYHQGVPVVAVPGPCALIAALSISGFEPHRFIFEGFLPVKKQRRRQLLQESLAAKATVLFYESPHRILSTLELLEELCSEIEVCVAREVSKLHEEVLRGPVAEVRAQLQERASIKGEIVLLLRAAKKGFSVSSHAQ